MQVFRDYRLIECETTMRRLTPIAIREVAVFDTEEVVPVVHAHWIDGSVRLLEDGFLHEKVIESTCSRCKRPLFTDPRARDYCPNCNAKMDEEVVE